MYRLVLSEPDPRQKDVLLSVSQLVGRLSFIPIRWWSFRTVEFHASDGFLGGSLLQMEGMSRLLKYGLIIADTDFRRFIGGDVQWIDGWIDAYVDLVEPVLTIQCVDTSFYEITTNSNETALGLQRSGFEIA